jgi:hypothetical protein
MNLSDLSLRIANTIGLLRASQEPNGRHRLVGKRNMTVSCDGGAGAQAGVLHKDGRTPRPSERRGNTHRGLSFASTCNDPCSSLQHRLVRPEDTVRSAGLQTA